MKTKRQRAGEFVLRSLAGVVMWLIVWGLPAMARSGETPAPKVQPPPAPAISQGVAPAEGGEAQAPAQQIQGPATEDIQEILRVLDQRKEFLARKEEALREAEARIAALRADAEKILDRYEAISKKKAQAQADARKVTVGQAVKMFESMPPEEAASRIDKMPEKTAMELLRELKPKTAGAILAQMKPDRAAKLAEKFLGPTTRRSSKGE